MSGIDLVGEVQEWLNWHAWRACVPVRVPWVLPFWDSSRKGSLLRSTPERENPTLLWCRLFFGGFGRMFYAYVLRSSRDGTYYYGHCDDLEVRLRIHNAGKVRYTKGHIPFVLQYSETFSTRKEAAARERFFKSLAGYLWLRSKGII